MSESESGPDLLSELAYEFADRYRRGERPSLTEYTGKHPELAAEIRDIFPALVVIEQFGSFAGPPTGPHAQTATSDGAAPRQLGEYRILREVARGGMGIVYEAVQESLGRHVALKVLPFQSLSDANHLERFRREAQAAAKLHHTNIVPIFGVGEDKGVHYFAMQFIKGQPLNSVLHELRPRRHPAATDAGEPAESASSAPAAGCNLELTVTLAEGMKTGRFPGKEEVPRDSDQEKLVYHLDPVRQAPSRAGATHAMVLGDDSELGSQSDAKYFRSVARVGVQVAEALAYAHQQGIVYRDIKPSNLLLDTQGTVWITDFGLAKAEGTGELTSPRDLLGTLRYMAPERFQGKADPRSDVFSMGLTLYEMVTLHPAFECAERAQLIERMLQAEPPRPRQLDGRIPRDLETLILKCIAKEPARRYQTAGELAEDLQRFLADRPILARRTGPIEKVWRWSRRNPVVAGMTIAFLLALLAGFVGATTQWIRAENFAENESRARQAAEGAEDRTRRYLYVARMNLAQQASETNQTRRLLELLGPYQPGTRQDHLRGFEWYYWWRTCHLYERSLNGNGGFVNALGFHSIRGTLVSGHTDGRVRFWDPARGMLESTLEGDGTEVRDLAFSPDGRTLAIGHLPSNITIWDVPALKARSTFETKGAALCRLAFSPDGLTLAAALTDGTIGLWDADTGQPKSRLKGHTEIVLSVAFSPNGRILASGSSDNTIRLWNPTSGELVDVLTEHKDTVQSVAFSPDGATMASSGDDLAVMLWQVGSRKPKAKLQGHTNNVNKVLFSPDGRTLASADENGMVRLWDPATGQSKATCKGHTNGLHSLAFSADSRLLASAGGDGTIKLWNLASVTPASSLAGHEDVVFSVAISPDSSTLASAGMDDGTIKLWNLTTGRPKATFQTGAIDLRCVVFSPDGAILASAHGDGRVRLWEAASGKPRATLSGHLSAVLSVAFSPDNKTLASVSHDRTVRLWDLATTRPKAKLLAPGSVEETAPLLNDGSLVGASVVFSPDGATLASANKDRFVTLWDLATRKAKATLEGQIKMPFSLAFSSDGTTLASAGYGQDIELWDSATGKLEKTLKGHLAWVRSVVFCPDGKTLVSASDDHTLVLWDVQSGEPKTILGHSDYLLTVAISPDGSTLASGSRDKTVSVWRAATEEEVQAHSD
jgi:eukaryotic-like serine/threonine-protein kinase